MMRFPHRARSAAAALAAVAGAWLLGACDPKNELLKPQQPGVISPSDVQTATGAEAIYVGTIGRLTRAVNGGGNNQEGLWNEEGLFTDEYKSADTFSQRNDADQRNLADNDGDLAPIYQRLQQTRGFARTAINALQQFDTSPTGVLHTAEMYFVMGYAEMSLSSVFCNGIPFGETVDGVPQYTTPVTDADGSTLAISRFDTALTILGSPTDDAGKTVLYATLIGKARAQLDLGDWDGAAATVASVPTDFSYDLNYSVSTSDNEWWIMNTQVKRYTVGDSIDAGFQVLNAIPFVSLKDPRVPTSAQGLGEDNSTPSINADIWGRDDPVALAWGGDARLIEAEDHLHNNDIAGMMLILNTLRASPQTIGEFQVPKLGPITTVPTTQDQARALFFREKALWQYGRGYRMDDLRRQVRQYGLAQDQVFPSGTFVLKTQPSGSYGSQTNFPVTDDERSNPNFHGCLDRNP